MTIAIYGRPNHKDSVIHLKELFDKLNKLGITFCVHEGLLAASKKVLKVKSKINTFSGFVDLKNKVDFVLSIGGDGTMLETVALVRDSGIPILGINTGRLGFLASVSKNEIDQALNAILKKKYNLDKRTLLRLETSDNLFGEVNFALNEITIHKKDSASMMSIHTYINGEFLNSYWADGLILSTPTGSTAYSLSCGGPIMIPDSKSFIITPIAPHNLNVRPMVISDSDILTLKVEGRNSNFLVSLDSRSEVIDSSFELTIKKEKFGINLIRLPGQNFMATLRNKLLWGVDKRN